VIIESGRIVAMECDGVWVETANQSACGRCSARKGCGQSLLAQVNGHRSYIKAAWNGQTSRNFREGDFISIGVHETAVLRGSLIAYCLPLIGLVGGATLGNAAALSEPGVVAFSIAGLILAAVVVHGLSRFYRDDERFQPVVIGRFISTDNMAASIDPIPLSVTPKD
jgi:sigma-E factor negative regulatory protein RseC